jgi:hypothetical protein
MIPVNTGKYKSKVKEWIRLYEKRLEQYRTKYGERNFKFKHHQRLINYKIKEWENLLKCSETRPNKAAICRKLILEAERYYNTKVTGATKVGFGSTFEDSMYKYFISKFFVDNKLVQVSSSLLGISRDGIYNRRRLVNKWMLNSTENTRKYSSFRKHLNEYMFNLQKSATLLQK